jgi:lecithin:retinol acyltransferase
VNYEIYCGPQRCVHPLAPGEIPPLGAHLVTPWHGYTHHGIHVGNGNVVHYGALMYDVIRKPVEEVPLAAFAEGRPVYVVTHTEEAFDPAEVIRRARSRLGEKRYRLLSNNCEHFVEWCLHDVHRSFQVETALEFPRWFGEKILVAILRFARKSFRDRAPAVSRVRIDV